MGTRLRALKSFVLRGRLIRQGEEFEEPSISRAVSFVQRGFAELAESKHAPTPENKAAPEPGNK